MEQEASTVFTDTQSLGVGTDTICDIKKLNVLFDHRHITSFFGLNILDIKQQRIVIFAMAFIQ
jgi:hypothetical protein